MLLPARVIEVRLLRSAMRIWPSWILDTMSVQAYTSPSRPHHDLHTPLLCPVMHALLRPPSAPPSCPVCSQASHTHHVPGLAFCCR